MADASFGIDVGVRGVGAVDSAAASVAGLAAKFAPVNAAASSSAAVVAAAAAKYAQLDAAAAKLAATQDKLAAEMTSTNAAMTAAKSAVPTGKFNELAEGFGKMGGPVGMAGQKLFGLADGLKKFSGAAGPTLTAVGAVAAGVALIGVAAIGAAVGVLSLLKKTILFADVNDRLGSASKKLDANLKKTFGGLKIDKLLDGLDSLVNLFDVSTASGRVMKTMFESLFQPLVDGIANAIPTVERAFLQVMIWTMKGALALRAFSRTEAFDSLVTGAKILGAAVAAVVAVVAVGAAMVALPFVVAGAAIAAVVVAIGKLMPVFKAIGKVAAVALAVMAAPFIIAGTAVYALGTAVMSALAPPFNWLLGILSGPLTTAWAAVSGAASAVWNGIKAGAQKAIDFLNGIDLATIGTDMILGLAKGITSAAGAVIGAIKSVVSGAISSAETVLDAHSPSRVFQKLGGYTAEGFAGGIEGGTVDTQSALESMVEPPEVGGALGRMREPAEAGGRGARGGTAGGGHSFTFGDIHVNAPLAKDAAGIAAAVREELAVAFEDLALQSGYGTPLA